MSHLSHSPHPLLSLFGSDGARRGDRTAAAAAQPLTLDVLRLGGDWVVVAVGDIDLTNCDLLVKAVDEVFGSLGAETGMVVDLSGVDFVGTVGLRVLLDTDQRCRDQGLSLRVVTGGRSLERVLRATGLDQRLRVVPSGQDDAVVGLPAARSISPA